MSLLNKLFKPIFFGKKKEKFRKKDKKYYDENGTIKTLKFENWEAKGEKNEPI